MHFKPPLPFFFSLSFTFILAPEENKALAENVLSLIVQLLLQNFRSIDQIDEVYMPFLFSFMPLNLFDILVLQALLDQFMLLREFCCH